VLFRQDIVRLGDAAVGEDDEVAVAVHVSVSMNQGWRGHWCGEVGLSSNPVET